MRVCRLAAVLRWPCAKDVPSVAPQSAVGVSRKMQKKKAQWISGLWAVTHLYDDWISFTTLVHLLLTTLVMSLTVETCCVGTMFH